MGVPNGVCIAELGADPVTLLGSTVGVVVAEDILQFECYSSDHKLSLCNKQAWHGYLKKKEKVNVVSTCKIAIWLIIGASYLIYPSL